MQEHLQQSVAVDPAEGDKALSAQVLAMATAGGGAAKAAQDEQEESSPIEEVNLTVSTVDDPSLPVMTLRMWVLGISSCLLLSFLNMFFAYRSQQLSVSSITAQILTLPLGRFMAARLPRGRLNPGPFNMKEHVLISILASAGASGTYAVHIITSLKAFYKRDIKLHIGLLVALTTQILGFGLAGIFRKLLVEPAHMWWPANLVQISLFRTLHEPEKRPRGALTRLQFFFLVSICSFAYYVLPGYLFPLLSGLSWVCMVWPDSLVAQQLGSGNAGYGLGALGLDWSTISGFVGPSPLATPFFAIANTMVGFIVVMYFFVPLAYWKFNIYNSRKFPLLNKRLYTDWGSRYNISRVTTPAFTLDIDTYNHYSKVNIGLIFALTYGLGFAMLSSSITYALLYHGKEVWKLATSAASEIKPDIHSRLMRRYKQVPTWWYVSLLVITLVAAIATCEGYLSQLQLRWWGVLFAAAISFMFILPVGILTATTNQAPGLNILSEYIIGYIYPNRPIANVLFKTYGTITISQTINLLGDFKLGHYMKVPPRPMFLAQFLGTVISSITYVLTSWWLLVSVDNICNTELLPANSQWTCPGDTIFFDASVLWGLIGPRRVFGSLGHYNSLNWYFLFGALAPVPFWLFSKMFPKVEWLRYVVVPLVVGGAGSMPYATPVNYWSWFIVGFLFNYLVFRYRKQWWQRHNYVLSAGLDAGLAFMGVLLYFCLGITNRSITWWGTKGELDVCPLTACPTWPGIEGPSSINCPVYTNS